MYSSGSQSSWGSKSLGSGLDACEDRALATTLCQPLAFEVSVLQLADLKAFLEELSLSLPSWGCDKLLSDVAAMGSVPKLWSQALFPTLAPKP